MSKIQDTKGRRDENSGYARLFGNSALGHLISRVHATVIRTGNELERLLEAATPSSIKADLTNAISMPRAPESSGVMVVFSPKLKKSSTGHGITGDIVVFEHDRKELKVIEVKDGDTFDTKKASGELESLQASAGDLARQTGYTASIYFCSFNQDDKESIVAGAKSRFSTKQVMTGRELCGILNIDYDNFLTARKREQAANLDFFLKELASIPGIGERLRRMLR